MWPRYQTDYEDAAQEQSSTRLQSGPKSPEPYLPFLMRQPDAVANDPILTG